MKKLLGLIPILTFSVLLLAPLGAQNATALNVIYDNGGPTGAFSSSISDQISADDFVLTETQKVTDGHFWTSETIPWDGTLEYFIYEDAGGLPGALIASGNGQNVQRNEVYLGSLLPTFEYWFDFEDHDELQAGQTYWLGLHLASNYDNFGISWFSTTNLMGNEVRFNLNQGNLPAVWSPPIVNGHFAFFLTGAEAIGGEVIPISATSLLVSGIQTNFSWIVTAAALVAGGSAFFVLRKNE